MLEFRCFGQLSWSGLTSVRITWDTFWIILSEALLVCGWNAVDFVSFMPSNRCSSVQKSDVNFGSQSLMIVSGSLWRQTTFVMNNSASWAAIVVVNGIRCTRDVNLHSTTQM